MKNPESITIKESISDLKKLRLKQSVLYKQKRIDCLLFLKISKFKTRRELSNYLGIHIRTQERWLIKYKDQGNAFMLKDEPKEKKSKIITLQIHQGLSDKVKNPNTPFLGYWDTQDFVYQKYGIKVKYHTLWQYLIKHFKKKLKSPRKSHNKKDEQAIEAFKKTSECTGQNKN